MNHKYAYIPKSRISETLFNYEIITPWGCELDSEQNTIVTHFLIEDKNMASHKVQEIESLNGQVFNDSQSLISYLNTL